MPTARKPWRRGYSRHARLAGFGAMAGLAADDRIGLPIFSHPAFAGASSPARQWHLLSRALRQITRLAGADGSIYPNYGGRFAYSRDDCRAIADATAEPMGGVKDCFPVPGGGMQVARVPELLEFYGNDVICSSARAVSARAGSGGELPSIRRLVEGANEAPALP